MDVYLLHCSRKFNGICCQHEQFNKFVNIEDGLILCKRVLSLNHQ